MSSFRNHRVVIASLFLPNTAVLDDSYPPSPDIIGSSRNAPPSFNLDDADARAAFSPVPLKSIVEDLTSRVASPATSPGLEKQNPFAISSGIATPTTRAPRPVLGLPLKSIVQDLQDKSRHATPQPSPRVETTNPFVKNAPRVQREYTHAEPRHSQSRLQRQLSRSNAGARSAHAHGHSKPIVQAWHVEPNPHCNGGLHNAVQSVSGVLTRKLWVGTLGTNTDGWEDAVRRNVDRRMLEECESLPVWIPDGEFTKCYDEFCHQVLWPALHYAVPDAPKTKSFYESASWSQYKAVNQRFADAIIANYKEGDIIWVNDYHLMLVPRLLRERLPTATIGFFLHVCFPSSEIFRCLSVREPLLRGLLAADLLGFQTANHARHFRQTVSRILALEALPKGIQLEDRFVDVGVFPMGIDVLQLTVRKRNPDVKEWVNTLKQRYQGVKLVVGRDKLDEVQGVRHKLLAFEMFLDKNPEFQQKVVLIQVALQTSEVNEAQGGVADVVSRINSRFSTLTYQPVVFLHTHDLTFSQYLALLTVADAFLVTSVREGMALRTHEFVECQEERHRPLILSEFTGSYTYRGFRSCIAINPWDKRQTACAIQQALTMSDEEAASRWEDLHSHVVAQSAQTFVSSFLSRCVRANIEHLRGELDAGAIAQLDVPRVLPNYRHSAKRLLLLDFEGTLWVGRDPRATDVEPPEDVLALLNRLTADRKNEVWLLSGLPVKGTLEKVAEAVPKIGIVAENGCFIKPHSEKGDSKWISLVANLNLSWKGPCLEILNYFTERTPGSFVEEREASVVWRFWTGPNTTADRQWARRQAAEAQNHVYDSLGERFGLRITPGANSFLVLPNNISRSTAVGAVLHPGGPAHAPAVGLGRAGGGAAPWQTSFGGNAETESEFDFVLAIGTDERLLRRLNELENAETVSTGEKGSDAKWRLAADQARKVLWQFANLATL